MSRIKNRLAFVILLSVYFCEAANTSLTAALFAPFAIDLGLNETEVGLVQGTVDIANFFGQIFLASVIIPATRKMFYTVGVLVSGVSVILFGVAGNETRPVYFFTLCVCTRAVMGVGASLVYASTVPLLTKLYPRKAGVVTSAAQVALGFGGMSGAPLGSLLASLGTLIGLNGYTLPYYIVGSFEAFLFLCSLVFIPSSSDSNPEFLAATPKIPKDVFLQFVSAKNLLLFSLPVLSMFALVGFKDVSYSPYLLFDIGVKQNFLGFVFLAITIPYICVSPIWGVLVHRGRVSVSLIFLFGTGAAVPLLFFLPAVFDVLRNVYYTVGTMVLTGMFISSLFVSCHLVFEKIAEINGFEHEEMRKLLVANWFNTIRALGKIIGSFLIGGVVLQRLKFNNTCLVHAVINVFLGSIALRQLWVLGILGRHRVYFSVDVVDRKGQRTFSPDGYFSDSIDSDSHSYL